MNYAATIRLNIDMVHRSDLETKIALARGLAFLDEMMVIIPVKSVQYRDDVYSGAMVHKSPELILELNLREGYTYTLLPSIRGGTARNMAESSIQMNIRVVKALG